MRFSDYFNLYRDLQAYSYPQKFEQMLSGRTQMRNTQKSLQSQISYEQYIRRANETALHDWNVRHPNRHIRYPAFSYPGQIYRSSTSIARAGFDYNTAGANYYGNLPYRFAGLYGVSSKLSRSL